MSDSPTPTNAPANGWYARIDDEQFGPVALTTLQHWASTGSLHGGCVVATSQDGPWQSAAEIPALQMEWQIIHPEGDPYELCHILSLRTEMESGEVEPDWEVVHVPTGESYPAVNALCSALISQNHILEKQLVDNFVRIRDLETVGAAKPATEEAETSAPAENWSEHMRERDQFAREASKWKQLYEEAQQTMEARETAWEAERDELKEWGRKSTERIRALERRRNQLEEMQNLVSERAASGEDPDLRQAYQELRLQLDHLMESLDLRNRQLESVQIRLSESEEELRLERSRRVEERGREQALREEALTQLNRIEEAHRDLTRSYRDLNERMIRLRNQMEAPAPVAAPQIKAAQPSAPLRDPAPNAPPAPAPAAPGKVKIKLT
ncbi:MAG: hypothetical protein JJU05_02750 [Verrucomicrobia bacterium]|nr:hypothetical protein [Verrucomicrobiota bacterium]MCH8527665.1 GYF domain-containing protein [Kiritimatiellia bacterium]